MHTVTQPPVSSTARPARPHVTADWLTEKFYEAYCYAAARIARALP